MLPLEFWEKLCIFDENSSHGASFKGLIVEVGKMPAGGEKEKYKQVAIQNILDTMRTDLRYLTAVVPIAAEDIVVLTNIVETMLSDAWGDEVELPRITLSSLKRT